MAVEVLQGFAKHEYSDAYGSKVEGVVTERLYQLQKPMSKVTGVQVKFHEDSAMVHPLQNQGRRDFERSTGGIDFTADKTPLEVQNPGQEIEFKMDPAMSAKIKDFGEISPGLGPGGLAQLQNAPGFVPVIINIEPMNDLKMFLGLESHT